MDELTPYSGYDSLVKSIGTLLDAARSQIATSVNTILVKTYWNIGKYIVEFEQGGALRAEYGSNLLNRLSTDLTHLYGKGFSRSNVYNMRKLYLTFPKVQTLSGFLSWSHYSEILKSDDPLEICFYAKECEAQKWSVRELKRQKSTALFQRFALSKDKEGILQLASQGIEVQKPEDIIRDPFGIVLGAEKDRLTVQYALEGINNQLFVSRYQLYLPDRDALSREVYRIIEAHAKE